MTDENIERAMAAAMPYAAEPRWRLLKLVCDRDAEIAALREQVQSLTREYADLKNVVWSGCPQEEIDEQSHAETIGMLKDMDHSFDIHPRLVEEIEGVCKKLTTAESLVAELAAVAKAAQEKVHDLEDGAAFNVETMPIGGLQEFARIARRDLRAIDALFVALSDEARAKIKEAP